MSTDDLAQELHDKATRGVVLSADEQARLNAWYAEQDKEESARLARSVSPHPPAPLQAQVDDVLAQLLTATQRVQEIAAQNDALRREIALLERQLAETPMAQPA